MKALLTKQRIMALAAIVISLVVVTSATVLGSGLAKPNSLGSVTTSGGKSGTTLTATVSAIGFWEQIQEYDWTVAKTASPTSMEIKQGETKPVNYTIIATRLNPPSVQDRFGVRGKVSVTNGGGVTTENLQVKVRVLYKVGSSEFTSLGASQTIVPVSQLAAGQTGTYDYQVLFSPVSGALYKVTADVTITNHSGSLGTPKGPSPDADFSLPGSPVVLYKDASATLNDSRTTPNGFSAITSQTFPIILTDSTTINYTLNIKNNSVTTGQTMQLPNTAVLTEKDTGQARQSTITVTITTGTSTPPPPPSTTGQGYSPGYWKNHTSKWPSPYVTNQPVRDVFTSYQGTATLLQALNFKGGNTLNGAVETLLRQGVAAVLNASSVDYPLSESQVITQVNGAIASDNRTTILNLANQLASYNTLSS